MRNNKIITIITTFALMSQMFASIVLGQNVSINQRSSNLSKSARNNSFSRYTQDIAQLVEEGKLNLANSLEPETEKVENSLAVSGRKGVVVSDYNNKGGLVIENLAARLNSENAARNLRGKRILKLDLGLLISDSDNVQQVAARLQGVLKQVENAKENVILYVENISVFSKNNPIFGAEIAKYLRQSIAAGKIQYISSATSDDYGVEIAADAQLKNRFKKVDLSSTENGSDDSFVGDKISPDLRDAMANAAPNQKVKVILQSDDVNNPRIAGCSSKQQCKNRKSRGRLEYAGY